MNDLNGVLEGTEQRNCPRVSPTCGRFRPEGQLFRVRMGKPGQSTQLYGRGRVARRAICTGDTPSTLREHPD